MDPTDPRPTPRRRRWQWLVVCGVLGLVVCVFLGGLLLDEPPPNDADLAPDAPVRADDGPDNPFQWPKSEFLETIARSETGLAIRSTPIEELDADFHKGWRGDSELVLAYEGIDGWCREFEHEFRRVGGTPWITEVSVPPRPFQGPSLPEEFGLLARLEFLRGTPERALHWALFEVRLALWAMTTAQDSGEWSIAHGRLDSKLLNLRDWVARGVLVGVRDPDLGSITADPIPWARSARLGHRDITLLYSTADGLDRFSAVPAPQHWRWKPNRFRRRHAEMTRSAIEEPDTPIHVEGEPRWVRSWIDPHGTGVLESLAFVLQLSRDSYEDTRASLSAFRVAVAITAFERDREALPESLEELVPTYLPAVPPDLGSAKWAPEERALVLFSANGRGRRTVWTIPNRVH